MGARWLESEIPIYVLVNGAARYPNARGHDLHPGVDLPTSPDVIIETGGAHGGSLVFYASLCKAMDKGRVVGIDIEIGAHNRAAIEAHPLSGYIPLIEGSSTALDVVDQVRRLVKSSERNLIILDSNRTYAHVHDELLAYAELVTPGSYIVATDGIMFDLADVPRGKPEWVTDNPMHAALSILIS